MVLRFITVWNLSLIPQLSPTLSARLRLCIPGWAWGPRRHARPDKVCRLMWAAAAAWEVIQRSIKPQQLSWDGCAGWDSPLQPAEACAHLWLIPQSSSSGQWRIGNILVGHGKVNKHCPVPCQSLVPSFCFFFLGQIWIPEINYSTGGDSRCIAALLEQRIKRHIGHSICTSQTLKFKIFINDLLKLWWR